MTNRKRRKYRSEASPNRKAVIIFVSCIVGSVLLSVIVALTIGNALGKAADSVQANGTKAPEIYSYDGEKTSPINASLLSLDAQTDDSIVQKIQSLPSGSEVSVCLRNEYGALNYRSDIARAVTGNAGGSIDLAALVSSLHEKSIYVSACFYASSPTADTETGRDAAIEYESALMLEILSCGVDDIIVTGLPADSTGIVNASLLFAKVREKSDGSVILGAALPYGVMLSDSYALAVTSYTEFADIFAIDTASCRKSGITHTAIVTQLRYVFEKYPIRVLTDISSDADRQAIVSELNSLGVYNIQVYKLSSYTGLSPAG